MNMHDKCLRCGRPLKDPNSQILGFGPSCYKKHFAESQPPNKKLFIVKNCEEDIKN
jgi:predicted  nucleic acid-binding Zn-ribbon protein